MGLRGLTPAPDTPSRAGGDEGNSRISPRRKVGRLQRTQSNKVASGGYSSKTTRRSVAIVSLIGEQRAIFHVWLNFFFSKRTRSGTELEIELSAARQLLYLREKILRLVQIIDLQ